MMLATMCQIWNLCCVTFRKKERWFNYATIAKNWLLHLGSPAHPHYQESVRMPHLPQFNKGNFKDSRKKNS
jgi:hypothetical protein